MRTAQIPRSEEPLPTLEGTDFDPPGCAFVLRHGILPIDQYPWDSSGYRPQAMASVARDDRGLQVLLCVREECVTATVTLLNGPVWRDSCLECFLRPFEDDARYLNIEVNPLGTSLVGFGSGRANRRLLPDRPGDMELRAMGPRKGWWAVAYRIPDALLAVLYGRVPKPGQAMYGNFYTCEESKNAHFGAWNGIEAPGPDFHRPECFGRLILPEGKDGAS